MPLGKRPSTALTLVEPPPTDTPKTPTTGKELWIAAVFALCAVILWFALYGLTQPRQPTQSKLSYSAACTTAAYPCQKKPNYVDGVGLRDMASTQRVYSTR